MGIKEDAARRTVIELITRKDDLKPYEVRLLQSGLNELGIHVSRDGAFGADTGRAVSEFLKRPENIPFTQDASAQTKGAIQSYSDKLQADAAAKRGAFDGLLEAVGLKDKPAPVPNPYNELFGPGRPNYANAMNVDSLLMQPNAFTGKSIEDLQKSLKISGADGYFGRTTSNAVIRHLTNHPSDWASIGTPILNLMMSDSDTRDRLNDLPKPPEFYQRVNQLIQAGAGRGGTTGMTFELQVLLNAGGYYKSKDGKDSFSIPDGGQGPDTDAAIKRFEEDYKRRPQRRAELDTGDDIRRYAQNGDGGGPDVKQPEALAPEIAAPEERTQVAAATPPVTKFSV